MLTRKNLVSKIAALLVAALVLSAIVVGCGGGDDSGSNRTGAASGTGSGGGAGKANEEPTEAESPAKAKFVKKANAICTKGVGEGLEALGAEVQKAHKKGDGRSEAELEAESIHMAFLPAIQTEIDKLSALNPPPGDEEQVEAFIDALQGAVDESQETEYTASSVADFGQSEFSQSDALAREYGLSACVIG